MGSICGKNLQKILEITGLVRPCLKRPGVVTRIGHVAAGVAEHVRVDREGHTRALAQPRYEGVEALWRHGAAALGSKHVPPEWVLLAL
jgi:hypothetical protein